MTKYLIDINNGSIIKEISADIEFWGEPKFIGGVEFVYEADSHKIALINKDFEFITDYRFDHADTFNEGLAAVEVGDRWGYINARGEFAIKPQFLDAKKFENGLAKVQFAKTKKYGYINKIGETIIAGYDYLGDFSEGLVYAKNKKSKSFKFLNDKGEVALSLKKPINAASDEDINTLNNFALQDYKYMIDSPCLVDMKFKMINDSFYDRGSLSLCEFHDGLCQFVEYTGDGPKTGFFDASGEIVIPAIYDFATRFHDGISFYSNGKNILDCKSGILTKTGEKIEIGDFYWPLGLEDDTKDMLYAMRSNKRSGISNVNGKYGFVDKTGKIVLEPQFDKISWFKNGMQRVDIGFLAGFVNKSGEYVIPAQYNQATSFNEYGYAVVSKYGEYGRLLDGIIDKSGNVVAPVIFEDIEIIGKDRFYARYKNGYMLYDIRGNPVAGEEFGKIQFLFDNCAMVDFGFFEKREYNPTGIIFRKSCGDGLYVYFYECGPGCGGEHFHFFGLMKEDGTILTPQIFEVVGCFSDGLVSANAGGITVDYIDHDGIPVIFDCYTTCSNFIDGVAYFVTHDWSDGSLNMNMKKLPDQPLVDGVTTFFINKRGDIVDLNIDEQKEFLRKYIEIRNDMTILWELHFEEYVKTE